MPTLQDLSFQITAQTDQATSSLEKLSNTIEQIGQKKTHNATDNLRKMSNALKSFDGKTVGLISRLASFRCVLINHL